jgi:hypothetical protein
MIETEWCTHCQKPRHTEVKCFIKHPHLKKEYEKRRAANRKRKNKSSGGSGDTKKTKTTKDSKESEDGEDEMTAFMCLAIDSKVSGEIAPPPGDNALSTQPLQNEWVVDTGCTNHATGTLAHFSTIDYGDFGTCGGIGGSVKFEGKGTVEIPIAQANGKPAKLVLTDVKYCPKMGQFNLISVSQLFKNKKAKPILSEKSISWDIGGQKINATAKRGLWLLDTTK